MTNETIFMNRELSWLKFNERVLEEAESEKNPLCERLTFASIYQSNLDEFFMVRVGSLIDQMIVSKNVKDNKTGMTAKEQIQAILARVAKLNRRKDTVYENLMDEVAQAGIRLVDFRKIGKKEGKYLEQYFDAEIAPLISPIVVGKRQPFPFLKNKGIYAVVVLEKKNGKEKLGIIRCIPETCAGAGGRRNLHAGRRADPPLYFESIQRLFCEGKISDPRNEKCGYRCRCVV